MYRPIVSIESGQIYRSRRIDSAINKLNCIMDLSKSVQVLHPEGIVMYMRDIYRLQSISPRCLRELIHSEYIPLVPKNFDRSYIDDRNTIYLVVISNHCIELDKRRRAGKFPSDLHGYTYIYNQIEKLDSMWNEIVRSIMCDLSFSFSRYIMLICRT